MKNNVLEDALKKLPEKDFYTSYLGNPDLKTKYADKIKVIVTRKAPGPMKDFKAKYEPALAPEWKTIQNYRATKNYGWMRQAYEYKLKQLRRVKNNVLSCLEGFIRENPGTIVFVCYCKDPNTCHRQILAEEFGKKGLTFCEITRE